MILKRLKKLVKLLFLKFAHLNHYPESLFRNFLFLRGGRSISRLLCARGCCTNRPSCSFLPVRSLSLRSFFYYYWPARMALTYFQIWFARDIAHPQKKEPSCWPPPPSDSIKSKDRFNNSDSAVFVVKMISAQLCARNNRKQKSISRRH